LNFRLTSAAEEEYARASIFLLEESPQAALSFVEEISSAIEEIAAFPTRYEIYEDEIRVKRATIHPYSIFYRIKHDHVEILSISHDARREGYWKNRT
jgi:plasmid stabilization system protein ParE